MVDAPDWAPELRQRLTELLGGPVELTSMRLLPGGASKEAWAVDVRTADGELPLLVRRAAGGVIHTDTLSLEDELRVLEAAHEAGVRVPRPYAYLDDVGGREAFVVERVEGETIVVTYYNAPTDNNLRQEYEGLPAKLRDQGIDPRIPWLYGFELDFCFR